MTKRTAEETVIGLFWGYDGAIDLGTPPRLFNQIVRKVAIAKNNTEDENVQLFTLINVAMADAGILAWDQKYKHEFCRPIVGLRTYDHSSDPGADTASNPISNAADPFWLPLGAPATNTAGKTVLVTQSSFPYSVMQLSKTKNLSPDFPAYPSGHATFGAAALHITRLFYNANEGGVALPAPGAGNTIGPDTILFKTGSTTQMLPDPDDANTGDPIYFISEEMNNVSQNNEGDVRPMHRRHFDSLWDMILENGLSRVFLGVHWIFDAYGVNAGDPLTPVFTKPRQIVSVAFRLD